MLVVPQWTDETLMFPTQSGKFFLFAFGIIVLLGLVGISSLFSNKIKISITSLDILLLLFIGYQVFRVKYFSGIEFYEFIGLIFFYIIIRSVPEKYIKYLLLFTILAGAIQAIYGNLQLYGIYPSHHGLFKMTGSFFNPGPYSGYLVSVLPIALGFYLLSRREGLDKNFNWKNLRTGEVSKRSQWKLFFQNIVTFLKKTEPVIFKYVSLLASIAILLVLPASKSRAAWLAAVTAGGYLLFKRYRNDLHKFFISNKVLASTRKWVLPLKKHPNFTLSKIIAVALIVLITGTMALGLYNMKKGSADGRLLIWKITLNMIKEKPIIGFGFGQFKAHYMDYQAAYFKQNPESEEAMVAGDTNYTFNELLQQTVGLGIVGLLIITLVLIIAFRSPGIHIPKCKAPPPQTFKQENENLFEQRLMNSSYQLGLISKAGVISILVFSLFSYPAQILPIKLNLVLYFAVLASLYPGKKIFLAKVANKKGSSVFIKFVPGVILAIAGFVLLSFGFTHTQKLKTAYTDWKSAYQGYLGAYDICLKDYEKAYPVLKTNGNFLTNYGKALSMAEEHEKAIELLQQAAKNYPNTVVYTTLGNSYQKTGQVTKAEQAYLHAWHMNPSRFYPKYLLAKLYDKTGQKPKAVLTARELLDKEIKIESTAIKEIREEMKEIINK